MWEVRVKGGDETNLLWLIWVMVGHGKPTSALVARHFGLTRSEANRHLLYLRRKGYVVSDEGTSYGRGRAPLVWMQAPVTVQQLNDTFPQPQPGKPRMKKPRPDLD